MQKVITEPPTWTRSSPNSADRVVGISKDGKEYSIPNCRFENMIDPAGNVVPVVVASNRETEGKDNSYGATIKDRRLNPSKVYVNGMDQRWLMYEQPPFGIDPEKWPAEREKIITERRRRSSAFQMDQVNTDPQMKQQIEQFKKDAEAAFGAERKQLSEQNEALSAQLEKSNELLQNVYARLEAMEGKPRGK
jgi:hypothetical protein